MSNRIKSFKGVLYGFLIASLLWVIPYYYFKEEPGPVPYTVTSVKYGINDNILFIVGNYDQKSCEFVTDGLFGSYLGNVTLLTFTRTPPRENEVLVGNHTVSITTEKLTKRYEWIEYRTRHRCLVYTDQFGNISLTPNNVSTPTTMLVDKIFVRIPTIGKFTGDLELQDIEETSSSEIQMGPDILTRPDTFKLEEDANISSDPNLSRPPVENFKPIQ